MVNNSRSKAAAVHGEALGKYHVQVVVVDVVKYEVHAGKVRGSNGQRGGAS